MLHGMYMLIKRLSAILMALICLFLLFPAERTTAAGDSIRIASVSPDAFSNYNDPVAFSVTINYTLQSADTGIVYLGFNTEQADVHSLVDDNAIVSKGSGTVTLNGTVTPAGWGTPQSPSGAALGSMEAMSGKTFSVYVNLSEYPHADSWEALAYDIAPLKRGIATASDGVPGDDGSAFVYNGHSYKVFDIGMPWDEAKAYCENLGGYLAVVTSEDERDFVAGLLDSHSRNFYWLGGTDEEEEGVWKWVTGEAWSYSDWDLGQGQPDNHSAIDNVHENYLSINYRNRWNDVQRNGDSRGDAVISNAGFICEWDDTTGYSGDNDFIYVDTLIPTSKERYTGNEGDSFINKVGTRNGKRGLNGITYQHGLEVWVARWNFKDEISWVWNEYELDANFASLKGTLTVSDNCYNTNNFDTTIVIYGDGQELESFKVTSGFDPIEIDVDVTGISYIRIGAVDNTAKSGGTSFLLGDLRLYWAVGAVMHSPTYTQMTLHTDLDLKFWAADREMTTSVPWGRDLFNGSSYNYNADLALLSSVLISAAHNKNDSTRGHYIEDAYRELGFAEESICLYDYKGHEKNQPPVPGRANMRTDDDTYAFSIASRYVAEEDYNLIIVTMRGTHSGGEMNKAWGWRYVHEWADFPWLNGKPKIEALKAFEEYYGDVYAALELYLVERGLLADISKNRILLTGHSLGAAAANLLGAVISNNSDWAQQRNVFCYAFATPYNIKITKDEAGKLGDYSNIFNIVNPMDEVPKWLPHNMGIFSSEYSARFGQTLTLPAEWQVTKNEPGAKKEAFTWGVPWQYWDVDTRYHNPFMAQLTQLLSSDPSVASISPQGHIKNKLYGDVLGFGMHYQEFYVAWMKTLPPLYSKAGNGKYIRAACPVDIEIYNQGGELVGKISGNNIDENIIGGLSLFVDGDVKYIYIPPYDDGEYEIRLIATGDGTMEFSMGDIDFDNGDPSDEIFFENVALTPGKTMMSQISGELELTGTQLFVLDDLGDPIAEVMADGTEISLLSAASPEPTSSAAETPSIEPPEPEPPDMPSEPTLPIPVIPTPEPDESGKQLGTRIIVILIWSAVAVVCIAAIVAGLVIHKRKVRTSKRPEET